MRRILFAIAALSAMSGCGVGRHGVAPFADTLYTPLHARGFAVYGCGRSSVISVTNPWQGARGVENLIFVSRDGENPPAGLECVVVKAPLKRVACLSSSHVAFIDALGRADVIGAVSGARYITNESVREGFASGRIKDVGYEGNINYELLAMLKPDVLFIYSVAGEKLPVVGKMEELGVPVVTIGEYLETSPLGKAEWVVAFGEMLGCRPEAEAVFDSIRGDYDAVAALAAGVDNRPEVMLNAPWRDTWFVPGDRSYIVRLINDAGARYVCRGVDSDQSRAINGETAYIYASKADYWLNPNDASSIAELAALNPNFADIPALRNGMVYNNTLRSTPEGGSDFWESGALRANVVLRDMVSVFHPGLLPGHRLYYFKKLE